MDRLNDILNKMKPQLNQLRDLQNNLTAELEGLNLTAKQKEIANKYIERAKNGEQIDIKTIINELSK